MNDRHLQDAFTSWNELSLDPVERQAYEVCLKHVLDQEAAVNEAKWREEKAREEGRIEEKEAIACQLLRDNIDVKTVVKATGLSIERIRNMKAELGL